jgi:hypothetical protein
MPLFLCFQSFGISHLEVGLSLSWEVLCLLRRIISGYFLELEKLPRWRSIFSSLEYVVNVCGTHQPWNKCHISGYFLDLEKLPQ